MPAADFPSSLNYELAPRTSPTPRLLTDRVFAQVYQGYWKRPCAIKKMRGMTKRRQLKDFYRESEILA
jgi:hypothetical protein